MSEAAAAESGDTGGAGTALLYTLSIFYLLIAAFIIVLAWILPSISISSSVAFTLLGAVLFVSGVIQLVYVSELAASLCGSCPPPVPAT